LIRAQNEVGGHGFTGKDYKVSIGDHDREQVNWKALAMDLLKGKSKKYADKKIGKFTNYKVVTRIDIEEVE
jgi:hypothetical protein